MRLGDLDHLLLKLDAELSDDARYIDIADQIRNIIENEPTVTPSLNLDNITEEDIEKFKTIWQRANSKGLLVINEERPRVLYLCDDHGCPGCEAGTNPDHKCNHTTDIAHAKNFETVSDEAGEDIVYVEKPEHFKPIAQVSFDVDKLKELTDDIVEKIKRGEIILQQEYSDWIPIKTRELTKDEVEELIERGFDISKTDSSEWWCYDCPLPEPDQEVLVCRKYARDVMIDTYVDDGDGCYFEDNPDSDDLVAWMPLPKPYIQEDPNHDE